MSVYITEINKLLRLYGVFALVLYSSIVFAVPELISDGSGSGGDGVSLLAKISARERYVVFESLASNLVGGPITSGH